MKGIRFATEQGGLCVVRDPKAVKCVYEEVCSLGGQEVRRTVMVVGGAHIALQTDLDTVCQVLDGELM